MKTLILYSSRDGQTQKIAQFIADKINNDVLVKPIDLTIDLSSFDLVIIGASVRYGHFHSILYQFVEKNTALLNQKQTAFFGVNLTARKIGKDTPETNVYVRKFLQKVKWQPNFNAVFAGALCYSKYSFFDRILIQFIMKITGGETDPSKEIEYTDWSKVNIFINQILNNK